MIILSPMLFGSNHTPMMVPASRSIMCTLKVHFFEKSMIGHHTCWRMISFQCKDDEKMQWHDTNGFDVNFVVGKRFGMLNMRTYCSCCEFTRFRDFFFVNIEQDDVLTMMSPIFGEKCLQIYLPNGDEGFFQLQTTNDLFCDEYVLQLLVDYDSTEYISRQLTVNNLFDTIFKRIKMRTMFKKLYFRCFRCAFRPDEKQAKLACKQWVTMFESGVLKISDR